MSRPISCGSFSIRLLFLLTLGASAQTDFGQTRFICTSIPVDMDPMCSAPMQNSGPADDIKGTIMQLRETILQQKETIMNQKETIRELTAKLNRCESQSAPEPPQYGRGNTSSQSNSLKDLLQNKIEDLERQVLSRVNSLEDTKNLVKNESTENRGQKNSRPTNKFQITFPLRTNYMYAKVKKSLPEMYAMTVCLWLKSNASPGVGTPFSYAIPGQPNELVLIEWGNNPMEILINDKVAKLPFVINDGKWHHICVTWSTRDGVWEAYQDGLQRGNGENLAPWHPIKPGGVLILGQEQDSLGGGFDATQAFVGEMSHFHMWDRVLTPGEIYSLANCSSKTLVGNVIAWTEANVDIFGGATKWTFEACRQIN
ncbi:neuronal pentraxin 1 like isoform X3 [Callorhinchus milii]|uniref:neuronal pentraxin 1 like isoform X3 n=1 Tax=Callorhinchus milii TaxID=7868 RepID=UPI001C3FAAAA|nr:neuronal pentraxin 1 like isoform X3 [Callorhinchus milii]